MNKPPKCESLPIRLNIQLTGIRWHCTPRRCCLLCFITSWHMMFKQLTKGTSCRCSTKRNLSLPLSESNYLGRVAFLRWWYKYKTIQIKKQLVKKSLCYHNCLYTHPSALCYVPLTPSCIYYQIVLKGTPVWEPCGDGVPGFIAQAQAIHLHSFSQFHESLLKNTIFKLFYFFLWGTAAPASFYPLTTAFSQGSKSIDATIILLILFPSLFLSLHSLDSMSCSSLCCYINLAKVQSLVKYNFLSNLCLFQGSKNMAEKHIIMLIGLTSNVNPEWDWKNTKWASGATYYPCL